MKRICVALFILLMMAFSLPTNADASTSQWWVFLRDRGPAPTARISPRAVERITRRGSSITTSAVSPVYVDLIRSRVAGVRVVSRWFNAVSVEATPAQIDTISRLPMVESVRRVVTFRREPAPAPKPASSADRPPTETGQLPVTDEAYGLSYDQLDLIGITNLHERGLTGKGVLICILDGGFGGLDHIAMQDVEIVATHDFARQTTATVGADHGANVLSILAANAPGHLVGAAPGATYALGRTEVVATETRAEEDYWIAGAEWADSMGADILTASLSYNTFDDPADDHTLDELDGTSMLTRAADIAVNRGIVVVTSAGNERGSRGIPAWEGRITIPSDGFGVISVGAVDLQKQIADFSSFGPTADGRIKPEVVAPGVNVAMTAYGTTDEYYLRNGTSYATPLIAGVAALLLEDHPEWSPADVRRALLWTSGDLGDDGPDNAYGYGLVNADAAASVSPKTGLVGFVTTVSDTLRVPVAGVRVEIGSRVTLTDSRGFFTASSLIPGDHTISFQSHTHPVLDLTASVPQTAPILVTLGEPVIGTTPYRFTPNPARLSTGVTIAGSLEPGTRFTVYSVTGEKVHELPAGQRHWNLRTRTGKRLATGVYLCHAERDGKTVWKGKLAVVR